MWEKLTNAPIWLIISLALTGLTLLIASIFKSDKREVENLPPLLFALPKDSNQEILYLAGEDGYPPRFIESDGSYIIAMRSLAEPFQNLWRVDRHGMVVDSLALRLPSFKGLASNGLFLSKDGYIDWISNGDKAFKPFDLVYDYSERNHAEIESLFNTADVIYEQAGYGDYSITPRTYIYYIKKNTQWVLVKSESHLSSSEFPTLSRAIYYPENHPDIGSVHPPLEKVPYNLLDPSLQHYTVSSVVYGSHDNISERILGRLFGYKSRSDTRYKLANAAYTLETSAEKIRFKGDAYDYKKSGITPQRMDLVRFPQATTPNTPLTMLYIVRERSAVPERINQPGLYIIRPKAEYKSLESLPPSQQEFIARSATALPITIKLQPFTEYGQTINDIIYMNGALVKPESAEFVSHLPAPLELKATYYLRDPRPARNVRSTTEKFAIKFNKQHFWLHDINQLEFNVLFDIDELQSAFNTLNEGDSQQNAELTISTSEVENGVIMSLALSKDGKAIELSNAIFYNKNSRAISKEDIERIFDENMLKDRQQIKTLMNQAELGKITYSDAATKIAAIATRSERMEAIKVDIWDAFTELRRVAQKKQDDALLFQVFNLYISDVFPLVGVRLSLGHFIKGATTLAIRTHNEPLKELIVDRFYSPKTSINFSENNHLFAHRFTDPLYDLALDDLKWVENYVWTIGNIDPDVLYAKKDTALAIEMQISKLIRTSLDGRYKDSAALLAEDYLTKTHDALGGSPKSSDVISLSLAQSVVFENFSQARRIAEKFIENPDKPVDKNNKVLLFNIACYYSRLGTKEQMLTAVATALEAGKTPSEFKADSDFKKYENDEDFLKLLETPRS